MIHKFITGLDELDSSSIELQVDVDQIMIETKISESECPEEFREQTHYLDNNDIDNLILCLTNLKREIGENKREMNK